MKVSVWKAESSPRRCTEPLIAWKQEPEQRGRKGKDRGVAGMSSGALLIRSARKCQEIETMTQYFVLCIDRRRLYGVWCWRDPTTLYVCNVTTYTRHIYNIPDTVTASRFK